MLNDIFHFNGLYRIQSKKKMIPSEIKGKWINGENLLTSNDVNASLKNHPWWQGEELVTLVGADVSFRSGLFLTEPDILIKKQFFVPSPNSDIMDFDFVDVNKSMILWGERTKFIRAIFGDQADKLISLAKDLKSIIINEYFCHEAGHFIGYAIRSKYKYGYFKVNGKIAWPLVFTEEFRADLHSFGFAANNLSSQSSISIFIYNILLRFGVELQSRTTLKDGYGAVPFLLFSFLYQNDIIDCDCYTRTIRLKSLDSEFLLNKMLLADQYAYENLTRCEHLNIVDIQINAAKFYKSITTDAELVFKFNSIFSNNLI
ncbi:MAG: hypothetical protein JO154_12055 [Chitinophaga sp.]|uniref:hypothetical protein n=1 Tax=Chitinophaga sp. TaxID=1869181 RepID=UPI0025C0825B|nr:hypothetical protein [Chitinophaga sp.]MBV8253333.1 hypothetical protein [Chitinophaga sp.]